MSGVASGHVELEPAGLDALDEILATDLVDAGAERLLGLLAWAKTTTRMRLAHAVRQDDGAAHHLVRVTRIDAEADVRLGGRVELGLGGLARAGPSPRRARSSASRSTSLAASWYCLPCWLMGPLPFLSAAIGLPRSSVGSTAG